MKHPMIKHIVNFLLLTGASAYAGLAVLVDVAVIKDSVGEISVTELSQELLLFLTSYFFFHQAKKDPALRGGMLLIGGFFSCMFIRELDAMFDIIHHGIWVYLALLVALGCVVLASLTPKTTSQGLNTFMMHSSFHYMMCGLVIVLVFSRIFGMNIIWRAVMHDDYLRAVKNIVEEGTELLGYMICFGAALAFVCRREKASTL